MPPQDWILATVLKFNLAQSKYIVLDDDQDESSAWAQPSSARQHTVMSKWCVALPLYEPSVYTPYNEFSRGSMVSHAHPPTHPSAHPPTYTNY